MKRIFFVLAILLVFVIATTATARADNYKGLRLMVGPIIDSDSSISKHVIDGATDAIEFQLTIQEAATVTGIKFRYGTRTGTPVQHKIGIQGVSTTTGRANGSYKTGTGECSATFTPPADTSWNDTWQSVTMTGTTCAITKGEKVAVVITPVGTPDGSNSSSFGWKYGSFGGKTWTGDYVYTVDAGSGTYQSRVPGLVMLTNATRSFGNAFESMQADFYRNSDEHAIRFSLPGSSGTYKIRGLRAMIGSADTDDLTCTLYDGTTSIASVTVDKDTTVIGGGNEDRYCFFTDSSLPALNFGSTYRIAISGGSDYFYWSAINVDNNQDLDTFPGGKDIYYSERSGGAWTDVTTRRPMAELFLDDITFSGGGSNNVKVTPNMSGGFQ